MEVLDASTLILIAKMEILDLFLDGIESKVAIPAEVVKECCGVKKSLDALLIQKALDESRVKVVAVKNRRLVTKLQGDFGLGRGEAEAIVLALAEKVRLWGLMTRTVSMPASCSVLRSPRRSASWFECARKGSLRLAKPSSNLRR